MNERKTSDECREGERDRNRNNHFGGMGRVIAQDYGLDSSGDDRDDDQHEVTQTCRETLCLIKHHGTSLIGEYSILIKKLSQFIMTQS